MINRRFLGNPIVTYTIIGGIIASVLLSIFTPEIIFFKRLSNYTVHFTIGLLLLGLVFLILDQKKLLVASFIGSAILSLFLKYNSNSNLQLARDSERPDFSVALVNLADITAPPDSLIVNVCRKQPDVIIFNEFTPDWMHFLSTNLRKYYPYQVKLTRIDNYGKATFSHLPIVHVDTISHKGIQHICSKISIGPTLFVEVFNTFFNPPLIQSMVRQYNEQMNWLIEMVNESRLPVIVAGDFSLPPWSKELRAFKYAARLEDSRRGHCTSLYQQYRVFVRSSRPTSFF